LYPHDEKSFSLQGAKVVREQGVGKEDLCGLITAINLESVTASAEHRAEVPMARLRSSVNRPTAL